MPWFYLTIAVASEVVATSMLEAAEGFTRWAPSMIVMVGYASAFYFLSLTLRTIPLGVAYAVWSGVGVALVSLIAWVVYRQTLDPGAIVGIALIVAGVVVLNLFSRASAH
ncbi:MAG: multidrug efflux SMR transporter [Isosphaeraceae bacterium]